MDMIFLSHVRPVDRQFRQSCQKHKKGIEKLPSTEINEKLNNQLGGNRKIAASDYRHDRSRFVGGGKQK